MVNVKRMKQVFNICSFSKKFIYREKDHIHFYCAVRSIIFKFTNGDSLDITHMNSRVREMFKVQFNPVVLRNFLKLVSI